MKNQNCCETQDLLRNKSPKLKLNRQISHHCMPALALPPNFENSRDDCHYPYITIDDHQSVGYRVCQYATLVILGEVFNVKVGVSRTTNSLMQMVFSNPPIKVGHHLCFYEGSGVDFNYLYNFLNNLSYLHKENGTNLHYPFSRIITLKSQFCPHEFIARHRTLLLDKFKFKDESEYLKDQKIRFIYLLMFMGSQDFRQDVAVIPLNRRDFAEYYRSIGIRDEKMFPSSKIYYKNVFANHELNDTSFLALCEDSWFCSNQISETQREDFVMTSAADVEVLNLYIYHWADYIILDRSPLAFMAAMLHNFKKIFVPLNASNPEILEKSLLCTQIQNLIFIPTTENIIKIN